MIFNILVEGASEVAFINKMLNFIYGSNGTIHTWKVHKHQGIGTLPKNINAKPNPKTNSLLNLLPAKLKAYEKIATPNNRVVVLLDLDSKVLQQFNTELCVVKQLCSPNTDVRFEIASEELEAWYLGDRSALIAYNQNISIPVLDSYVQDSILGTWELLMDADEPSLRKKAPKWKILQKKVEWSKKIPPKMSFDKNLSPSFNKFLLAFSLV